VRYGTSPGQITSTATGAAGEDHVVTVGGLQADTVYFYSVGTASVVRAPAGGVDADQYRFRTSPLPGTRRPFRFWVVGDDGTGGTAQAKVVASMKAHVALPGQVAPELFLHVGDMAYNSGTEAEFTGKHFAPHWTVLRNTFLWPAMGNHEGVSSSGGSQSGPYYRAYVLPRAAEAGGVPSGTEAYYSFDYANVHFVVLNSHDASRSPTGAMATWLKGDLLATDADWIVASFHHPPYTDGTHVDTETRQREMRENLLPILEQGGVDLVLAGHSHIYERSHLVEGIYGTPVVTAGHLLDSGGGRPDGGGAYRKPAGLLPRAGTVYVVAGHGGASLGGGAQHPVMYVSEKAHGSVLVDVDGDRLELTNLRNTGVVSDRFVLVKDLLPDGGVPVPDAGTPADAGESPDAGAAPDAGNAADGGPAPDAGATGDAGAAADGGAPGTGLEAAEGAWGCAGAPGGLAVVLALLWLAAWAQRPTAPAGR
ncbi:MAG: metallophosphoesterase family protein, partial [Deltaproteobacteria bacterium]|nr:metallophosphoesterase family protein [Deltaproteobacteria bacterium]